MSCMTEETFGPTLPVVKVADEEEAIRLANDSRLRTVGARCGLRDVARGERIARRLEAGAVNVNDALANGFNFALPMGGWKHSGIGARNGGAYGLLKYCRTQAITAPRMATQSREICCGSPTIADVSRDDGRGIRAAAGRGSRRLGIKPRGGRTVKCQGRGAAGHRRRLGGRGDHARPAPRGRGAGEDGGRRRLPLRRPLLHRRRRHVRVARRDHGGHGRRPFRSISRCSAATKAQASSRKSVRACGRCGPATASRSRSSRRAGPAGGACRA